MAAIAASTLQLRVRWLKWVILWAALQCASVTYNLPDVPVPAHVEENIPVRKQAPHDVADTGLAHDAKAPDPETADEDELCTQRERLEDVGCAADARVVHDVDFVADSWARTIR